MGKVRVIGVDSFTNDMEHALKTMKATSGSPIGKAIFAGAKIVTDEIRSEIQSMPRRKGSKKGLASGVTDTERAGMLDGLGISRAQNGGGFINVHVGFNGYNSAGKPNAMVARSFIAGTSWLQKNDFVGRSIRKTESAAEAEMQRVFEAELKKRGV